MELNRNQAAMRAVDNTPDYSEEEIIKAAVRNVATIRLQQLGRALWTASDEKVIAGMVRLFMAFQGQAHATDEIHKEPATLPKAVVAGIDALNEETAG